MVEKFLQMIGGKDSDLRERLFRCIILFGGIAAFLGTAESFFVMKMDGTLLTCFLVLLVFMAGTLIVTFKYKKYNMAATLLYFLIEAILFPILFFLSGGVHGAPPVWFSLAIMYVFVMFAGKKLVFYLILTVFIDFITFWVAYNYPETVVPMASELLVYTDSFFGLVAVGFIGGLILKTHMRIFDMEHEQNVAQRKEIEASRDSRNVFFANMSHEIRTPINTIIGLNEMILRESQSEVIRSYAKDIELASGLLLGQVNDILDLSQMEMQKMSLHPAPYKTTELFHELAELFHLRMEKKNLKFVVDIDAGLPKVLVGDVRRIKQILINLLDNAVKYTEKGSIVLAATGDVLDNGQLQLNVSVEDTGVGIRKENIANLYDVFNRVDEKKNSRILGSGLGLAITKQLIDLMEGEISIDSIYKQGSTFTVTVPQQIEDAEPIGVVDFMNRMAVEKEAYRPTFEAPEACILIVDDNAMNTRVASSLLSSTKVQIDVAMSGAECLELTKTRYYHVILLDYMMPGMDGLETLKLIRRQENGMCRESGIIALTANATSGAREMYQKQGFDSYVEKPIVGKVLESEILKLLPEEVIAYEEREWDPIEAVIQTKRHVTRKRKKFRITTDSTCDIPEELLEKHEIKMAHMYIQVPHGRFVDFKEIDTDMLDVYSSEEEVQARADSLSVEEYEEFFADNLREAEKVIHISLASYMGPACNNAMVAAKSFDHVHVIDSGQCASGQGLLVLTAVQLALAGMDETEICEELERVKSHIRTRIVLPNANVPLERGTIKGRLAALSRMLKLHPVMALQPKKLVTEILWTGTMEQAWKKTIRLHLRRRKKISRDMVFITCVNCNVKQQELIKSEIEKYISFDRMLVSRASFATACSTGNESIIISCFEQGNWDKLPIN